MEVAEEQQSARGGGATAKAAKAASKTADAVKSLAVSGKDATVDAYKKLVKKQGSSGEEKKEPL